MSASTSIFNAGLGNIVLAFARRFAAEIQLPTIPFGLELCCHCVVSRLSAGRHHYLWSGCCADKLTEPGSFALLCLSLSSPARPKQDGSVIVFGIFILYAKRRKNRAQIGVNKNTQLCFPGLSS